MAPAAVTVQLLRNAEALPYTGTAQVAFDNRELAVSNGRVSDTIEGFGRRVLHMPQPCPSTSAALDKRNQIVNPSFELSVNTGVPYAYEIYDNKWGGGLGLGYEFELHKFAFVSSASYWEFEHEKPSKVSLSLDLGYKSEYQGMNGTLFWETDFHYEDDGTETVLAGPALYWNFNDTVHMRLEWKHDFHNRQGVLDHGNGDRFLLSLGLVF